MDDDSQEVTFIDLTPQLRERAEEHPGLRVTEDGWVELKPGVDQADLELDDSDAE